MQAKPAPIGHHAALYRYWDDRRAARPMPTRRDIAPEAIPALLPYVTLIGVEGDRFKYRLVGTNVAESLGRELTGTYVGSHVGSAHAADLVQIYRRVCASGCPLFSVSGHRRPDRASQSVSRVVLPLGGGAGAVDMLLTSRISRYAQLSDGADWLASASGRVAAFKDVASVEEVEALAMAWDQDCVNAREFAPLPATA